MENKDRLIGNRFNLIDERWISVADEGLVSLRELFGPCKYRRLGGNPIQKIAMMKFLQAIAQAAFTPENEEDWKSIGEEGLRKRCLDYLEKFHNCFFLFGERPFLQFPQLNNPKYSSLISSAVIEVADGNTTIWSQMQLSSDLSDSEKALLLLTLMGFAKGGKGWGPPRSYFGKDKESKGSPPGISLGDSLLHTFCQGISIQQTLWLNLITHTHLKSWRLPLGIPPWEKLPCYQDDECAKSLANSLMGRLAPLSRFCRLVEDHLYTDHGIEYPLTGVDPSVTKIEDSKKAMGSTTDNLKKDKLLKANPAKRPWRALPALLSFLDTNNKSSSPCEIVHSRIGSFNLLHLEIWSGGLCLSNTSGEQFIKGGDDDFVESSCLIPSNYLNKQWFSTFQTELKELELIANELKKKVRLYFKELESSIHVGHSQKAENLFWQLCEKDLMNLIDACEQNNLKEVRSQFVRHMQQAFNFVCSRETARQLEAWAKHRPRCEKYLNYGGKSDK